MLRLERDGVPAKVAFQEVRLPSPVKPWPIEVVKPQGWIVRLHNGSDVQLLLNCCARCHVDRAGTTECCGHHPVDLRGSFNRLYSLVVSISKAIRSPAICFCSATGGAIASRYCGGMGRANHCAKRLEHGRFTIPVSEQGQVSLRGKSLMPSSRAGSEVKKNWYRR